jgi:drug/metabolite transporter (DMT)-like permease
LKEKISLVTLISIILGMCGVLLILGSSLSIQSNDQFFGNIIAFIMPISFAILVIIVRKFPNVDMVPAQFTAGVAAAIIGFLIAEKISISLHDIFLASLAGFFQIGFGFILITLGSQTTPAAVVGVLMLTESVFGPFWAWLFINEIPPFGVLIGGGVIIFSILFQTFLNKNQ